MDSTNAFLSALFAPYAANPEARLELRALYPDWFPQENRKLYYCRKRGGWFPRFLRERDWFPLTPSALAAAARTAVRWGHDVYMGVLPRLGRTGGMERVIAGAWMYADVDGDEGGPDGAVELIKRAGLPKPHIAVISGGGCHVYWKLAEPVLFITPEDRTRYKERLQRLTLLIGGKSPAPHADPSCADVARILRIPCTVNWKREHEPRPVVLKRLHPDAPALSYAWWGGNLPPLPAPPAPRYERKTIEEFQLEDYQRLVRWSLEGYPEGHRHKDLAGGWTWLIKGVGVDRQIAEELFRQKAANSHGTRRITEQEVEGIIRWK